MHDGYRGRNLAARNRTVERATDTSRLELCWLCCNDEGRRADNTRPATVEGKLRSTELERLEPGEPKAW
jgi:hypothetical protein